jgi:hypothetical protein
MSLIPRRREKQGAKAGNHVEKSVHMLSMRRSPHTRRKVGNPGSTARMTAQITLIGRAFYITSLPEGDGFSIFAVSSGLTFGELFCSSFIFRLAQDGGEDRRVGSPNPDIS